MQHFEETLDFGERIVVQQADAEQAAKVRAAQRARLAVQQVSVSRAGAGTVKGNRQAGARPLAISIPSFGTRAYPFRSAFMGTTQARLELTCVRRGTTCAAPSSSAAGSWTRPASRS